MPDVTIADDLSDDELALWLVETMAAGRAVVIAQGGRVLAVMNPPAYRLIRLPDEAEPPGA